MVKDEEILKVAEYCRMNLDFQPDQLGDEYGYAHLPLCVIDAVFSIGVNYAGTRNTAERFSQFISIEDKSSLPLSHFIEMYDEYGVEGMADDVFQNRQRTSTRSGILKAEAVLRFSEVLVRHGVEYLTDVPKIAGDTVFEKEIKEIPGQRSGISLRYFYMLAGDDKNIKPDRMILRFLKEVMGKDYGLDDAVQIVVGACDILEEEYPGLTPRYLDNLIWRYQRGQ